MQQEAEPRRAHAPDGHVGTDFRRGEADEEVPLLVAVDGERVRREGEALPQNGGDVVTGYT